MKQYISRNLLLWLAWSVFLFGIWIQVHHMGTINGSALIPLPLIYLSMCIKGAETNGRRHKRSHSGTAPQTADGSMRKSGRA
jgi:hypothetical protein